MNNLIRKIVLLLISLSLPVFAGGEFFQLSDVGSSARMIRLGNVEGFSGAASSVFENPAALYRIKKASVSLFSTTFMDEVSYKNVSVGIRMPAGMLGFGYMTAGVNDIPLTDKNVFDSTNPDDYEIIQVGSFGYNNSLMKMSYQISQTKNLHIGASLSYFNTSIYNVTGSGFNLDAGIIIDTEKFGVSILMRNLVSALKVKYSNNESETLPLQSVYSGRYTLGDVQVLGQLKVVGSNKKFVKSFGLEYNPKFLPFISLSAGLKEFPINRSIEGVFEQTIASNSTLGLGLNLFGVDFDYAYEQSEHVQFNHKHYFSLALGF